MMYYSTLYAYSITPTKSEELKKMCYSPAVRSPSTCTLLIMAYILWWVKDGHEFFANPPIKRYNLFPLPLNLGWPCNLFWPRESGSSNAMPLPDLSRKKAWQLYFWDPVGT